MNDVQIQRARQAAERRLSDVLTVLLPGHDDELIEELRTDLGPGWPRLPVALPLRPVTPVGAPASEGDAADARGAAGEGSPQDAPAAAEAVRAALTGRRRTALGELVDAARRAGALDAALALDLLEHAAPARLLPGLLADADDPDGLVPARLRALTGRHLAADPARWAAVRDTLGAHRGTLSELFAAVAPEPAPRPRATPRRATATAPAAPPASGNPPRTTWTALALLLAHADPADTGAVLERLPDPDLHRLLGSGSLPPAGLVDAVTDHGGPLARTALAGHPLADARLLKRLVAADDPTVNATAYHHPRATPSLRRSIAAGTPQTPGRTEPVPLDLPTLLGTGEGRAAAASGAGAASETGAGDHAPAADLPAPKLRPLLASGDPMLVAAALTLAPRRIVVRWALLDVWRHRGPEAVRPLLDDPALHGTVPRTMAREITAALDDPAGAARLLATGEPYDDPDALVGRLHRHRSTDTITTLLNEPYAHDFPTLMAGHLAAPYMPAAAAELLRHEDATDEDRRVLRTTVLNDLWRGPGPIAGRTTDPAERLATESLGHGAEEWALECVRAGLLDPGLLLDTAHPAAPALTCLRGLVVAGELPAPVATRLTGLSRAHLGSRAAWAELLAALGEFPGTLTELLERSGAAAPADPPPTVLPAPEEPAEPHVPRLFPYGRDRCAALAAIDLLITLDADSPSATDLPSAAVPPVPDDPAVLAFLARTAVADRPGPMPRWLVDAWPAAGVEDPDLHFGGGESDATYLAGIMDEAALFEAFPALLLALAPHDWQNTALLAAAGTALTRRLERELGADAGAWLRLLGFLHAQPADTRLTWSALLDGARTAPDGDPAELARAADAALAADLDQHRVLPWLPALALAHAGPDALAAVLPAVGASLPRVIARQLRKLDNRPPGAVAHLARTGGAATVTELARFTHPPLPEEAVRLVLERADPAAVAALLAQHPDAAVQLRAAAAPVPGLVDHLSGVSADRLVGGIMSPRIAMIEEAMKRTKPYVGLPEQLLGALNLARLGGREGLRQCLDSGDLGPSAASSVRRALRSADPVATLEERTAKEFTTARLVKRLRDLNTWEGRTLERYRALPYAFDWDVLEAEHARQPFAVWSQLIDHPATPEEVALRHRAVLRAPDVIRWWDTPALFAARTAQGVGRLDDGPLAVVLDEALRRGLLTGRDLIHRAVPGARVLRYLSGALAREDSPWEPVADAADALAELVRAADPADWGRLYAGLTGQLAGWKDGVTVARLLDAAAGGQADGRAGDRAEEPSAPAWGYRTGA
ncbi:hypothetical protein ACWEQL_20005 [Kitasatospora sp. NPDC004240]